MRKLFLLALIFLLSGLVGCVASYSKLEFVSFKGIEVQSVSLLSSDVVVSAVVANHSSKDLEVDGLKVTSRQFDGIELVVDSAFVFHKGENMVNIPAKITYSPLSLVSLISKANDEFTLDIKLILPHSELNLRKKVSGKDLSMFLKKLK